MAKFKVHLETALKLIPHLVMRPQGFSVQSVSSLIVEIDHPDQDWMIDTINLLCRKDPTIKATQKLTTEKWGYFDDMSFPLTSPADLREGFEPTSNLNLWEDATHQITFDGGKHWTNVIQDEGDPEYFVACSDGKRSWRVERFPADQVVKRPEYTPGQTVTGRISDPHPQPVVYGGHRGGKVRGTPNGLTIKPCPYRHPPTAVCPHCQDWERKPTTEVHCTAHVDYAPETRIPASVGESPACDYTDTCFDSDPSEVGE